MDSSGIISIIESSLFQVALSLKLFIEGTAIAIVAFSVLRTIPKIIRSHQKNKGEDFYISIRLDLGVSLALSLEFLLAADIVATAVSPSIEAIGFLAAIAGIRTFLNYFLHKEVKELEQEKLLKQKKFLSE
jgi:uncharacterized membrane protein